MPRSNTYTQLCLANNQTGLSRINKNSPCDGYFGCDEDTFEEDGKALLRRDKSSGMQYCHLPWTKRKSPPVVSFFKKIASLRKKSQNRTTSNMNYYHTLPEPKTRSFYFGYQCFPYHSGIASLKRDYCCDGYFGCASAKNNVE